MAKVVPGGKPRPDTDGGLTNMIDVFGGQAAADMRAKSAASVGDPNLMLAEELAGKKNARLRGGSRMLLSEARVNAQEGLSSGTTLG
jgi:hypothetical protein